MGMSTSHELYDYADTEEIGILCAQLLLDSPANASRLGLGSDKTRQVLSKSILDSHQITNLKAERKSGHLSSKKKTKSSDPSVAS